MRRIAVLGFLLAAVTAHAAAPRVSSVGVQMPGCQLATDTGFDFIDWNLDGNPDLFLDDPGMINGHVHLNEGSPTAPKFGHSLGYSLNLTEAEPYGMYFTQTRAVCDLNHDGLWDMLVYDGQLRLIYNTGTKYGPNHWNFTLPAPFFPGSAQMIKENTRFTIGMESMYWGKGVFPRLVLTLTVADWDGDGLEDLLICRFKDEAPGIKAFVDATGVATGTIQRSTWMEKLTEAPARGLYFYKNTGTREKPWFNTGVEITTPDGQSIAAPNPVIVDFDGDGKLDVVSTETAYVCNAFRVDWPTRPSVKWFRRSAANILQPAKPVTAAGKPVAAGVQARFMNDDLFVLDPERGMRWYPKSKKGFGPPTVLQGAEFARFGFMYQPLVVDWFGPNSRDLIVHGCYDPHCQYAIRRTALYRNTGGMKYEFAGFLNYQGDRAMVPQYFPFEERPYDVYGSYVALLPGDATGKKRLMMSVNGKLHLFTDLAADGLTFQTRKPVSFPYPESNRMTGWQEIPVNVTNRVQFIRINNERNGLGANRDSYLHIVAFEALANGKNWAPNAEITPPRKSNPMLKPGNQPSETQPNFTTLAYALGPATLTLPEPVALEKIRFLLTDREPGWYSSFRQFTWQGRPVRQSPELGELWFNYKVEVSADQTNWTVVADHTKTLMMRSCPVLVDWNRDGKFDLVLGVLNVNGIWPVDKEYRLYLNNGSNDEPRFDEFTPLADETGKPLKVAAWWLKAYGGQCGLAVLDGNGDGKLDLVVEEAEPAGSLRYYENVAADPTKELRFKFVQHLGAPVPIDYQTSYRYFYCGDVDGDGLPDVINSNGGMILFRGMSASGTNTVVASTGIVLRTAEACYVDATKPAEPTPRQPSKLEVRTLTPNTPQKQRLILLRFTDLPKLNGVTRATLELTTDPKFERYPLQGFPGVETSCSTIRDDWDATKATFAEAAPGKPWAPGELNAGGAFLAMAKPINTVQARQTVEWDVTPAVRAAFETGRNSVSLLLRAEYNGKYTAGLGYNFCGTEWPQVESRPRLRLETTP